MCKRFLEMCKSAASLSCIQCTETQCIRIILHIMYTLCLTQRFTNPHRTIYTSHSCCFLALVYIIYVSYAEQCSSIISFLMTILRGATSNEDEPQQQFFRSIRHVVNNHNMMAILVVHTTQIIVYRNFILYMHHHIYLLRTSIAFPRGSSFPMEHHMFSCGCGEY